MASAALLLVGAYLVVVASLAFFKPKQAIFFLLLSRPIIDNLPLLGVVNLPEVGINGLQLIGVLLPCILLFVCLVKKLDLGQPPIAFFDNHLANSYFLFILTCLPALIGSERLALHLGDWLKFLTFWAMLVFARNFLRSEADYRQTLAVVAISSLYPLARFALDLAGGHTVKLGGLVRILGGYYRDKNIFAADLLICFVPAYLFHLVVDRGRLLRGVDWLGFLFLILCLVATKFRTNVAAVLLMAAGLLVFRRQYLTVGLLAISVVTGFIALPVLRAKFWPLIGFVQNLPDLMSTRPTIHDALISTRFGIYRILLTTVLYKFSPANLLAGYGYDLPLKYYWVDSAHFEFLQLFFRYGLLPALLFYRFLLAVVWQGIRARRDLYAQVITSFVIGVAVISLMGNPFSNVRVLWFLGVYVAIMINRATPPAAERA